LSSAFLLEGSGITTSLVRKPLLKTAGRIGPQNKLDGSLTVYQIPSRHKMAEELGGEPASPWPVQDCWARTTLSVLRRPKQPSARMRIGEDVHVSTLLRDGESVEDLADL